MSAAWDEVNQSEEEGISVYPSKTSTRILNDNGLVRGVELLDVESFSFDEDMNPEIEVIEDSHHIMEADAVIFAVGQSPDIPDGFFLDKTERNLIELDSYTFETNIDGVFAAGDAVTGTSSVIQAIASGRKAAVVIDRFLEGDGRIDEKLAPVSEIKKCFGPSKEFAGMTRMEETCIFPEERLLSFCRVVNEMDEETAEYEANRCLQCDSRLTIKPVKFWGNY
jgi:hypothetical protein